MFIKVGETFINADNILFCARGVNGDVTVVLPGVKLDLNLVDGAEFVKAIAGIGNGRLGQLFAVPS